MDLIRGDLASVQAAIRKYLLTFVEADKKKLAVALVDADTNMAKLKDLLSQGNLDLLSDLSDVQTKFETYITTIVKEEARLAVDPATRPQAIALATAKTSDAIGSAVEESTKSRRAKVAAYSDKWTAEAARAITETKLIIALAGIVSLMIGVGAAWAIVRAISRPLKLMTESMRQLASGNTGVMVPALGRADEIGQMAGAEQIFKDAAIEKTRLEVAAVEARHAADAARTASEALRKEANDQQTWVVVLIAEGLERLSEGNLIFRLNKPFAPEYEKLRTDFNGAMTRLQEAMKVVSDNTSAIHSGSQEITTAADDLSRRTEQQAASLEETAAALDEITTTVKKTAEGALHAREVVLIAKPTPRQAKPSCAGRSTP